MINPESDTPLPISYQAERKTGSWWEYMCSFDEKTYADPKAEAIKQKAQYLKLHPREQVRIVKVTKEILEIPNEKE